MTDLTLRCHCGKVAGVVRNASPGLGNRIICYCNSCRLFAEHLNAKDTLDEYGGTDIYQVPISHVELTQGRDRISCLHVTAGGPFRWYAKCCGTPIGNTGTPGLPFMGVIHSCMDDGGRRDEILGPVRADLNGRDAKGPLPADRQRGSMTLFIFRFMTQLLFWKLAGKGKPNPVFDESGEPLAEGPTIG
jgi:hypothetical protein